VEEIEKFDHRWSELLEKYKSTHKAASVSYQKVEPLVKYFEGETIDTPIEEQKTLETNRCISADFLELTRTLEELTKHVEQVEKINNEGQITEVEDAHSQYDRFEKILTNT